MLTLFYREAIYNREKANITSKKTTYSEKEVESQQAGGVHSEAMPLEGPGSARETNRLRS